MSDPLSRPDAYKGSTDNLFNWQRDTLSRLVRWFDYADRHHFDDEYRGTNEFLNLREIRDEAARVLKAVP